MCARSDSSMTDLGVILPSCPMVERTLRHVRDRAGPRGSSCSRTASTSRRCAPGRYAFWKGVKKISLLRVDMRETMVDVGPGQEMMTSDKVTLRMNAIGDLPRDGSCPTVGQFAADDARQALYREAQLVLRSVVGPGGIFDGFLTAKDAVAQEVQESLHRPCQGLGPARSSRSVVRDVILPGDMKDLHEQGHGGQEGRRGQPASPRREETAAMRSQANTAKLLVEVSPTSHATSGTGSPGEGCRQRSTLKSSWARRASPSAVVNLL